MLKVIQPSLVYFNVLPVTISFTLFLVEDNEIQIGINYLQDDSGCVNPHEFHNVINVLKTRFESMTIIVRILHPVGTCGVNCEYIARPNVM